MVLKNENITEKLDATKVCRACLIITKKTMLISSLMLRQALDTKF